MVKLRKDGRPSRARQKGEIVSPLRAKLIEMCGGVWKSGTFATWVVDEFGISSIEAARALRHLADAGHLGSFLDRLPGQSGGRSRYFLPENRELAFKASREAAARVARLKRGEDEEPEEPKWVGEIVPCKAVVWANPARPAGVISPTPGVYLDPPASAYARALERRSHG